jgi:3-methyl-2-oxobutanoate hydroxymethyltransferase
MKNSVRSFLKAKQSGEKLSVLTAYDYPLARLMDEAGVNGILVGDSLGMVVLGHKTTLPVTMEDMIRHSSAVARGVASALLITDMPFLSYQTSVRDAVRNAGRLVQEGNAEAVKLEGGEDMCPQIRAIVRASIPVMGHIGLTPQSINAFGGFSVQGKDEDGARGLLRAAKAVEAAGAFAVVLECIPAGLAALITRSLSIPTIGIGAGGDCDGQVLVCQDMLGMFPDFTPKFVKRFADLSPQIRTAFADYVAEVRQGAFPGPEHSFSMDDTVLDKIYGRLE